MYFPECPYCSTKMKLRNGARGQFWGCPRYPNCKGTRNYVEEKPIKLAPGSPEQMAIWNWLENGTENGILPSNAGTGKAQPLDAKVLTPDGWKLMGDIQVGDKVIDPDGGIADVLAVYPQGEKNVMKITFSDGSQTECCENHLWLTATEVEKRKNTPTVKTTKKIKETLHGRNNRFDHYIPMVKPVEFSGRHLLLHPYLMGVLLGNGHFGKSCVLLSTTEQEIVNKVKSLLPKGCQLDHREKGDYAIHGEKWHENAVLSIVRDFGLEDCKAEEKFIPEDYLYSSVQDRINLLQGLMDTDGSVYGTTTEYCTVSPKLMVGVKELVQSLGGKVKVMVRDEPVYTYKGEQRIGQTAYRLYISFPKSITPFLLKRKADKYIPRSKYQPARSIVSVDVIGKKECQCIAVNSSRNLYVTDDYIVTHNTYTIVNGVMRLKGKKVAVFSFNTHIVKELNERLAKEGIPWASGMTYNSFGNKTIKNSPHFKNSVLFKDKVPTILAELYPDGKEGDYTVRAAANRLVDLCKNFLIDGTDPDSLNELVDRFNVEVNGDCKTWEDVERRTAIIFDLVPKALKLCLSRKTTYDYNDQVWWVVKMNLPVEKFDIVMIDECQDTNKMQQALVEMVCP